MWESIIILKQPNNYIVLQLKWLITLNISKKLRITFKEMENETIKKNCD